MSEVTLYDQYGVPPGYTQAPPQHPPDWVRGPRVPMSGELGTYRTVKARCWSWLSCKSP